MGNHGPREASYTKLQANFVANQDFLGFSMVDIHRKGCSQRSAPQKRHAVHLRRHARCTPRRRSGLDWGGDKSQTSTGGHCAPTWEGHKTQAQPSLRLCGVPEYLNLSDLDMGSAHNPGPAPDSSWQSNLEPEQCRQGKHTHREQGQTQCGRDTASTPHTCQ